MRLRSSLPGIFLASLLLFTTGSAAADIYRYVDRSGKMHGVGDLSQVPPEFREAAKADLASRKSRHGGSLNVLEGHGAQTAAPPSSPAQSRPHASNPAMSGAGDERIGGHEQGWWRAQAYERRKTIAVLEKQHETTLAEEKDWSGKAYGRPGPGKQTPGGRPRPGGSRGGAAAIASALSDDEPTSEEIAVAIEQAKADFEDFMDFARRSGVPSGWLR